MISEWRSFISMGCMLATVYILYWWFVYPFWAQMWQIIIRWALFILCFYYCIDFIKFCVMTVLKNVWAEAFQLHFQIFLGKLHQIFWFFNQIFSLLILWFFILRLILSKIVPFHLILVTVRWAQDNGSIAAFLYCSLVLAPLFFELEKVKWCLAA